MNLRDLKYITAVAELRSFVHAAEKCHISQPTLSTQIKKLEENLGVQLFERNNKKVLPTEAGEKIIASALKISNEVDHIQSLALMAQDPLAGNFSLGAFPTLSTYIFPGLVPVIRKSLPKLRLILIEEKTEFLINKLKQGKIDAALLALPMHEDSLIAEYLFTDDFRLAVAPDNPLAQKKSIKQSELYQQQLLLLDEGHCLRGQALQVCQLNGAEQQDLRATGLETLRLMVKAGTGITFIPEIAIQQQEADICYLAFDDPAPNRKIALVWRKTSARLEIIQTLIPLIKTLTA